MLNSNWCSQFLKFLHSNSRKYSLKIRQIVKQRVQQNRSNASSTCKPITYRAQMLKSGCQRICYIKCIKVNGQYSISRPHGKKKMQSTQIVTFTLTKQPLNKLYRRCKFEEDRFRQLLHSQPHIIVPSTNTDLCHQVTSTCH